MCSTAELLNFKYKLPLLEYDFLDLRVILIGLIPSLAKPVGSQPVASILLWYIVLLINRMNEKSNYLGKCNTKVIYKYLTKAQIIY